MPIEVPPLTGKQKKPAATEWGAVPQTPPRVHAMEGHAASCETMPFTNPDDEFLQTESRTVGARGWQERDGGSHFTGAEVHFGKMAQFWRRAVGTARTYETPLNRAPKSG